MTRYAKLLGWAVLIALAVFGGVTTYGAVTTAYEARQAHWQEVRDLRATVDAQQQRINAMWNYLDERVGARTVDGRAVPFNRADGLSAMLNDALMRAGSAPVVK